MNGRRHAPGARESAPGLRLRPRRGLARTPPPPPPLLPIHHLSGITRGVTGGMDTAVRTKPRGRKARAPNCARCAERTLGLAPAAPAPPAPPPTPPWHHAGIVAKGAGPEPASDYRAWPGHGGGSGGLVARLGELQSGSAALSGGRPSE